MVFTLLVPSTIAQRPTWARVVTILQGVSAAPTRTAPASHTDHAAAGIREAAAH